MTTPFLLGDLARDEGRRLQAYPDPLSSLAKAKELGMTRLHGLSGEPWTIGYGHCGPEVHEGLTCTPEQATAWLRADIATACAALDKHAPWWRELSAERRDVLASMCFNMGWPRLSGFVKALAAMRAHDYATAAAEMLDSRWARQVGKRATRLAEQMRTGERRE